MFAGAMFGGYGSFLPAYQPSPVWSHQRTPQGFQHYGSSRSPSNLQTEGGHVSYASSTTAPQSARLEPASSNAMSLPVSKVSSSLIDSVRKDLRMPSTYTAEELARSHESKNKMPANLIDPKMLKVRIKVGSDNLSTQKNAAIYSGLGLDVSPSSSLGDSPSESVGMSHEPQETSFESPAQIIRRMTSLPAHGGRLLSPLPKEFIHLTEKQRLIDENGSLPTSNVGSGQPVTLVNGSDFVKGRRKNLGDKKAKSLQINEISSELQSESKRESNVDAISSKERDCDTLACEELVSKALKLPLLSNSYSVVADKSKGSGSMSIISKDLRRAVLREKGFSDISKEESEAPMLTQDDSYMENQNGTSARKVWADKKDTSTDSASVYTRKDGHCGGEKPDESIKIDLEVLGGRKTPNTEPKDHPKHKAAQKAKSFEQEVMKSHSGKESSSSEGKKKMKGSQSHDVVSGIPKESLEVDPSWVLKSEKSTHVNKYAANGGIADLKLQKNTGKSSDKYREFFGEIEPEQEENQINPPETGYRDRLKDSNVVERSTCGTDMLKGSSGSKKIHKLSTSRAYPDTAPSGAFHSENGHMLDAAPSATVPVLIKDNWVCCDKCQTWRLLPIGKNPNDLPEKWVCSMLDWLPFMNRCSFSEEETTNALIELYQVPAREGQTILQGNPGEVASKVTLAGIHLNQNFQNIDTDVSTGAKKNHGLRESSNAMQKDGSVQLSNSVRKNCQEPVANGILSDMNQSHMVKQTDFPKLSKPSMLAVEKQSHKHKVLETCSNGGNVKRSKMKGKKDRDKDLGGEFDHVGAIDGQSLGDGLPAMSTEKNLPKYSGHTSKDSKYGQKDQPQVSDKKTRDKVRASNDGTMDIGTYDTRDGTRKRKMKEAHDTHIYLGSTTNSGQKLQDSRILAKEKFSESDQMKKKARVSRSEGRESSTSKGNSRTGKKGSLGKNKHLGQDPGSTVSQWSLDGVDSSRRDFGSVHPSVAATSSSSKVSGSHKTKANFHDVKGSPVESVSSLPVKVSKPDKLTSARKDTIEKDESDAGFIAEGGLRRCTAGEDDGRSNRSGTARKLKTIDVAHQGSLESPVPDFQEKDFSLVSGDQAKLQILPSRDINLHCADSGPDYSGQVTQYHSKATSPDQYHGDERQNESHCHANGLHSRKRGKLSSSHPKENGNFNPQRDNGKTRFSNSIDEQEPPYKVKLVDGRNNIQEKIGMKRCDNENGHVDTRHPAVLLTTDTGRRDSQSDSGEHSGADFKVGAVDCHETNKLPDVEMISGRGKLVLSASSGGALNEALAHYSQPVSESQKGNGSNILAGDKVTVDNESKVPKQIQKAELPNGIPHTSSKSSMSNGHRIRDFDASSPVKRDSSSQVANSALKEAKSLKHMADRIKNSGSHLESARLYFEAVLKFLHGAALMESCSLESSKTGEFVQSMQIYSSTAKLCEFCAREYEKLKDMATAALAYKCTEVAYMRVIYSSYASANRDRNELQTALQMIPPGESPSSSASDIDNLNHPTSVDKFPLAKGVSSPQLNGSHIITARNRQTFARLLNFAQEVNSAMEASRKSRIAFAAANVCLGEAQGQEIIASIKTALDFNFQDVEGLLHLVRLAIEAINC
uniref:CW-type domain-containing protein n=3 Tax=Rhizophora mucronata TaxID=61149 RepID=A0A2P2MAH3_RHIMU